ncbi:MAG: hypothetical protein WB588_12200 [Dehalococcoidia bacterium]|jgi:hypothetical protein
MNKRFCLLIFTAVLMLASVILSISATMSVAKAQGNRIQLDRSVEITATPGEASGIETFMTGADPVTGRNGQIDLSWEQLCLSTWYQLQIAKDKDFTQRINPMVNWGNGSTGAISAVTGSILLKMDSTNSTSPAAWIPPGSLPEAGATYYWRIRSVKSATGQIADSPWSETRSFSVKPGFIINTPYYGVQLLSPNNGGSGVPVHPVQFSWSPWFNATKYQFDLAQDPEFKQMVISTTTTTTAYGYSGSLDYSTSYFWRVKAVEISGQNIPSDWSATFSFQTEVAPAPAIPVQEPAVPLWVWVTIAIGAILVIATLVLVFKTRR